MAKLCPQCREPSGNADLRRLFCEIRFHCPVCLDDHDARVTPSYALRCGHVICADTATRLGFRLPGAGGRAGAGAARRAGARGRSRSPRGHPALSLSAPLSWVFSR